MLIIRKEKGATGLTFIRKEDNTRLITVKDWDLDDVTTKKLITYPSFIGFIERRALKSRSPFQERCEPMLRDFLAGA